MTSPNTIIADMQLVETNLRQQIAHLNDEIAGLKSDVAYVEKQRDEYKNDAADFQGQVNRLTEWNNNLVSHRDELLADVETLRKQRDELLAALENILSAVPAQDGGGGFVVDHHSSDGEYIGSQNIDPMWVVQEMATISYNAIAIAKGESC